LRDRDEPKGQETKVVVSRVVRNVAVDDDKFLFVELVRRESGGVDVVGTENGKLLSAIDRWHSFPRRG
jgi:hypothetical protein